VKNVNGVENMSLGLLLDLTHEDGIYIRSDPLVFLKEITYS